jgi:hypothetical protein
MARDRRAEKLRGMMVLALTAVLLGGCLAGSEGGERNVPSDRGEAAAEEGADSMGPADHDGETAVGEAAEEAAVDGEAAVGGGEQPDAGDQPKQSEAEILAGLERAFDSYVRVELPACEYFDASLVMLDEHRLVYTTHTESEGSDRRIYSTSIRLLDIAVGETTVIAADLPYRIDSIAYRAEAGVLEAAYFDYEREMEQYAAWELSGLQSASAAKPRWTLSDNGRWTLFRSNDAPGIWAEGKKGGKPVRVSRYAMDQRPLWFPGEDSFLYLAHTGNLLADGSGFEYELASYDLESDEGSVLPYDAGIWHLIGWAEPGKTVLVDHAFNEGEVVAYTEPRLLDLRTMAETRLTEQALRSYNRAYNEAAGELTVQVPGHFIHYDQLGRIRSVSPWAYEGGEIDEVWPQSFSPDGSAWAYVTDVGEGSGATRTLVLADVESGQWRTVIWGDAFLAPLAWSPDGERFAVMTAMGDHGVYVGVQDTKAAWEPHD